MSHSNEMQNRREYLRRTEEIYRRPAEFAELDKAKGLYSSNPGMNHGHPRTISRSLQAAQARLRGKNLANQFDRRKGGEWLPIGELSKTDRCSPSSATTSTRRGGSSATASRRTRPRLGDLPQLRRLGSGLPALPALRGLRVSVREGGEVSPSDAVLMCLALVALILMLGFYPDRPEL